MSVRNYPLDALTGGSMNGHSQEVIDYFERLEEESNE